MIDLHAITYNLDLFWTFKLHRVRAEKTEGGFLLHFGNGFWYSKTYEADLYWVPTYDSFNTLEEARQKFPNALCLDKIDFFPTHFPFRESDLE